MLALALVLTCALSLKFSPKRHLRAAMNKVKSLVGRQKLSSSTGPSFQHVSAGEVCGSCQDRKAWILGNSGVIEYLRFLSDSVYGDLRPGQVVEMTPRDKFEVLRVKEDQTKGMLHGKKYGGARFGSLCKSLWRCHRQRTTVKYAVFRYNVTKQRSVVVVAVSGSRTRCDSDEFCFVANPNRENVESGRLNENLHSMAQQRAKIVYHGVSDLVKQFGEDDVYFTGLGYGGAVASLVCELYRYEMESERAQAIVFSASDAGTREVNCRFRDFVINLLSNSSTFPRACDTSNEKRFIPLGCTFADIKGQWEHGSEWAMAWGTGFGNQAFLHEDSSESVFKDSNTLEAFLHKKASSFGPIPACEQVSERSSSGLGMILWTKLNPVVVKELAALSSDVYKDLEEHYVNGFLLEKKCERCISEPMHNSITKFKLKTTVKANIYRNDEEMAVVVAVRGSLGPKDLAEYFTGTQKDTVQDGRLQIPNLNLHSLAQKRAEVVYGCIRNVAARYEKMGYQLYFTSHSYGGAVAPLLCLLYRDEHPKSNAKSVGFCSAAATVPEANHYFTDFSINILNHGDIVPFISPDRAGDMAKWLNLPWAVELGLREIQKFFTNDNRTLVPAGASLMLGSDSTGLKLQVADVEREKPEIFAAPLDDHRIASVLGNMTRFDFFNLTAPPVNILNQLRTPLHRMRGQVTDKLSKVSTLAKKLIQL